MRNSLFCLLALISACAACQPAKTPSESKKNDSVENRIDDLKAKTVALVEEKEDPLFGSVDEHVYCSGVWIDPYTIVTANHCVAELKAGDPVSYSTPSDQSATDNDAVTVVRAASLQASDPDHDLALIRAMVPPAHGVAALAQNVFVGEPDATMGHPLGLLWSYSEGVVAAVRKTADPELDIVWIQNTAPISPGNSGSGLFNYDGELMGICSRGFFGNAENLNFYVHVDYVRALYATGKSL